MHQRMKGHDAYRVLPAKVAQWVLRALGKNWQSFFAALAAVGEDRPSSRAVLHFLASRTSRRDAIYHRNRLRDPVLR